MPTERPYSAGWARGGSAAWGSDKLVQLERIASQAFAAAAGSTRRTLARARSRHAVAELLSPATATAFPTPSFPTYQPAQSPAVGSSILPARS